MKLSNLTKVLIIMTVVVFSSTRLSSKSKRNDLEIDSNAECIIFTEAYKLCRQLSKEKAALLMKDYWDGNISENCINGQGIKFSLDSLSYSKKFKWHQVENILNVMMGVDIKNVNYFLYINENLAETNSKYFKGLSPSFTPVKPTKNVGKSVDAISNAATGKLKTTGDLGNAGFGIAASACKSIALSQLQLKLVKNSNEASTVGVEWPDKDCINTAGDNAKAQLKQCDDYVSAKKEMDNLMGKHK